MPPKKHIIIIGVLSMISLGLGYWYGMPKEGSGGGEPKFLKEGLVAYYPFNGNAKDESGNGNDGIINGVTLTEDRHGVSSSAYSFDGNQFISLPNSTIGQWERLTFTAWVRAPQYAGSSWPAFIGSGTTSKDLNISLGIYAQTGKLWLEVDSDSHNSNITGNLPIPWDTWFLATMVYDGAALTEYLNGVAGKSISASGSLNKVATLYIGAANLDYEGFKGQLDDIRIYNRALSEAEVKALYEFEKPKTQQASTVTPPTVVTNVVTVKPKPTPTPVKPQPTPTRQLTLEEKKVVGTYESVTSIGITNMHVYLDNGLVEGYQSGKKRWVLKWAIVDKEVHFGDERSVRAVVSSINPDGSLTMIADIQKGRRTDRQKGRQYIYKKIK